MEDFGRWKVENFKAFARDILLNEDNKKQKAVVKSQQAENIWHPGGNNFEGEGSAFDAQPSSMQSSRDRAVIDPYLYDLHANSSAGV